MSRKLTILLLIGLMLETNARAQSRPWKDKLQTIPGRVQCEFYDQGGEGAAYHDTDSINNGSGKLNPANGSFLNEFRMKEGVDISYTKSGNIDNNGYNLVRPEMDQLYVGWTVPGEWINYTVTVTKPGTFHIGLMYTANTDGAISLSVDGNDIAGKITIPSTHRNEDTVAWRQWHHWNKKENIATIKLGEGRHVLTLYSVSGNMNYDYLEFSEVN
jgi:hypothetical protein